MHQTILLSRFLVLVPPLPVVAIDDQNQRIVMLDGLVRNEGDMEVAVRPYQIPYRIMLPKRSEATNVLVPVAFSASYVAYSSVRMEQQYMILGQAAGVAAKTAIAEGIPIQQVSGPALITKLRDQRAIMEYAPSAQSRAISLGVARIGRMAVIAAGELPARAN